jgi:hypothetical protein
VNGSNQFNTNHINNNGGGTNGHPNTNVIHGNNPTQMNNMNTTAVLPGTNINPTTAATATGGGGGGGGGAAAAAAGNNPQTTTNGVNGGSSSTATSLELNKDITMYRAVLRNELLGTSIDGIKDSHIVGHQTHQMGGNSSINNGTPGNSHQFHSSGSNNGQIVLNSSRLTSSVLQPREMTSVFQYGSSPFKILDENSITSSYAHNSPYSLSPLSPYSQKLLRSPRKPMRKIPKVPFKVLDAPELQDDFYLNLVDWSSTNVLGVGLGTCVYLWSACTSQVTRLCDLAGREDSVSSVAWSEKGNYIAVGTFKGEVQIWDAAASKLVNTLTGHTARVGALAWNHDLLCSGSRDRNVLLRDIRAPANEGERKLAGHKQEVI